MDPADSFLKRLQPLDNIHRLLDRTERFGTKNDRTLGMLLVCILLFWHVTGILFFFIKLGMSLACRFFCFLFLLVAQCWCIWDMYIAYHLLILLACNCITNSVMCILYLFCMFYNLDSYYQALFLLLLLTSLYLSFTYTN